MKTLRNIFLLLLIVSAGSNAANAQTSKKEKQAAKEANVKSSIEAQRYTFMADFVLPQRGGGRQLTSDYDLRVTKDSVIAYLPYFGRAYFDVPYNPTDGGIKFTSTKFEYKVTPKKKGGWEITINPKDARNTSRLVLNVSTDGYASLSVTSVNRDFITFDGYLKERDKK
ncbi:MAG TPA: DUF4251 domain-containing protein [Mucilaginibacter sp.]|nr:DUF4251 domain-containing protein [Mucilaginibacter sp.]